MCIIRLRNAGFSLTRFLLAAATVLAIILLFEINEKSVTCVNEEDNMQLAVNFLENFGWQPDESSADLTSSRVPYYFDSSYEEYNLLQKSQGFNLENYKGRLVSKYDFVILNYPGFEDDESIHATVLIYNGAVIGGDIKNVKMDGFMCGFKKSG